MKIKDEDGIPLGDGDYLTFTFGIPPTCVTARIYSQDGTPWVECLHPTDVQPKHYRLHLLMKHHQVWKASKERVAAVTRSFAP